MATILPARLLGLVFFGIVFIFKNLKLVAAERGQDGTKDVLSNLSALAAAAPQSSALPEVHDAGNVATSASQTQAQSGANPLKDFAALPIIQPHESDEQALQRIMSLPYEEVTGAMLNRVVKAKQDEWHDRAAAGVSRAHLSKEMSAFDRWLDRVIAATKKHLAQKAQEEKAAGSDSAVQSHGERADVGLVAGAVSNAAPSSGLLQFPVSAPLGNDTAASSFSGTHASPRPQEGNAVDAVAIGILVTSLYNLNPADGRYTAEATLTSQWKDPRNVAMLAGLPELVLSSEEKIQAVWSPAVALLGSSTDVVESLEVYSRTLTIYASGRAVETQRVKAEIRRSFSLEAFPYDAHKLGIVAGSSKYDTSAISLSTLPAEGSVTDQGLRPSALGASGFALLSTSLEALETRTGGSQFREIVMLTVKVQRLAMGFHETVTMPVAMLLTLCSLTFWMPLWHPSLAFRLGLSVVAFVTSLALLEFVSSMVGGLPCRHTLGGCFVASACMLTFLTLLFHTSLEVVQHRQSFHGLVTALNDALQVAFPLVSALSIFMWLTVGSMMVEVVLCSLGAVALYCFICLQPARHNRKDKAWRGLVWDHHQRGAAAPQGDGGTVGDSKAVCQAGNSGQKSDIAGMD